MYTGPALAQVYVANEGDTTVSIFFDGPDTITVDLGDITPQNLVVSPDGDFVYVITQGGKIAVIQTSDNKVIATVDDVGNCPCTGIAITPDGSHLYVASSGDNIVSVIQTSDNTVVDTVAVGLSPTQLAVSTDGDYVFTTNLNDNTVSVIQTSFNAVVATVDLGNVGEAPYAIVANAANGDFPASIFVTLSSSNKMCVLTADPPFRVAVLPGEVLCFDVGEEPLGIAGASIGDSVLAFVANFNSNIVSIFEVNGLKPQLGTITVGQGPFYIVATPGGGSIYVTNQSSNTMSVLKNTTNESLGSYTVVQTLDTGNDPEGIAIVGDTDTDGVSNKNDTDSDNDGITNNDEATGDSAVMTSTIALRNGVPNDSDGDGIANLRDLDSDGDCIPDHFEAGGGNDVDRDGLSDNFVDVDMDGLHDEHDPDQIGNSLALPDTDNDGTPDFLDRDSDNDGRTDAEEAGGLDEDGDGIHDETEDLNRDGLADACHPDTGTPLPILDLNSNGVPDHLEDRSNDGGSSSCALASPGASSSFPLYLLIPVLILIRMGFRRRTN